MRRLSVSCTSVGKRPLGLVRPCFVCVCASELLPPSYPNHPHNQLVGGPMNWKDRVEILYMTAATISAVGTALAAGFAAFVYRRNSALERAKWASSLYEKFYEATTFKQMRDRLDCLNDLDSVNEIVIREEAVFTDYLNFFEFIAFLNTSKQLTNSEIEALFGYYLDCLNRHDRVKQYILNPQNGYEGLADLLSKI
jgi:hypothetical protein